MKFLSADSLWKAEVYIPKIEFEELAGQLAIEALATKIFC